MDVTTVPPPCDPVGPCSSNHSFIPSNPIRDSKACDIKKILIFVTKILSFFLLTAFILCIPMGDPQETCTVELCKQQENISTALAYNYVCNVYRAMVTTMKFTTGTMHRLSEYTGCFIINALYEAKIKFYTLLTAVDQQDLCRTVCCQEDKEMDLDSGALSRDKSRCKCKAKCCKRQAL